MARASHVYKSNYRFTLTDGFALLCLMLGLMLAALLPCNMALAGNYKAPISNASFKYDLDNQQPSDNSKHSNKNKNPKIFYNNEIQQPAISIIIDDLGNLKERDIRAIKLPGAVTCSFLPMTPYAKELAKIAHNHNKEVMLHLPMEAMANNELGPGGLTMKMSHEQFTDQIETDLKAIPYAVGVNNHMGSFLTQQPGQMRWLMQDLAKHGNLYFVDSFTTKYSVGQKVALQNWVPTIRRNVFLDDYRDPAKIKMYFRRLLRMARDTGIAVAIGHPYPETLAVLEEELPKLAQQGIKLLPVSKLIKRDMKRFRTWRAYLSP
jgi:polysaccharide deacetylase 2 family uncharacterized protein YibQ